MPQSRALWSKSKWSLLLGIFLPSDHMQRGGSLRDRGTLWPGLYNRPWLICSPKCMLGGKQKKLAKPDPSRRDTGSTREEHRSSHPLANRAYISYLVLCNNSLQNLMAFNNSHWLSLTASWVRNSDRAQQRWLFSAPQFLESPPEDPKTEDWTSLKEHSFTHTSGG